MVKLSPIQDAKASRPTSPNSVRKKHNSRETGSYERFRKANSKPASCCQKNSRHRFAVRTKSTRPLVSIMLRGQTRSQSHIMCFRCPSFAHARIADTLHDRSCPRFGRSQMCYRSRRPWSHRSALAQVRMAESYVITSGSPIDIPCSRPNATYQKAPLSHEQMAAL